MTEAGVALGHMLSFEQKLSRTGTVSCNTYNVVGAAGVDHLAVAVGDSGRVGTRTSPTVYEAAFLGPQFWDGRAATLEEQAGRPIQAHVEMNLTPAEAIERLRETGYLPHFEAVFPDDEDPLTFENLTRAIASFGRTLITPGSPFDRYLTGEHDALTETKKEGLQLFTDAGCAGCHDGSAETLHEAVSLMGSAQLGRTFTEEEVEQIEAFLDSLSDEFPLGPFPRLPL